MTTINVYDWCADVLEMMANYCDTNVANVIEDMIEYRWEMMEIYKRRNRCQDCICLKEGYNHNWICDACGENIIDIGECKEWNEED